MTHLWIRAEQRENEDRVGLTPDGERSLIEKGIQVSVEDSQSRIIPIADYADAGCEIVGGEHMARCPERRHYFRAKGIARRWHTPDPQAHYVWSCVQRTAFW